MQQGNNYQNMKPAQYGLYEPIYLTILGRARCLLFDASVNIIVETKQ